MFSGTTCSLDYNPFAYVLTFTSPVLHRTVMYSDKDAQRRVFIHCAAEVFIMVNQIHEVVWTRPSVKVFPVDANSTNSYSWFTSMLFKYLSLISYTGNTNAVHKAKHRNCSFYQMAPQVKLQIFNLVIKCIYSIDKGKISVFRLWQ